MVHKHGLMWQRAPSKVRYYVWIYWVLTFAFHLYRRAKYQILGKLNGHTKRAAILAHIRTIRCNGLLQTFLPFTPNQIIS